MSAETFGELCGLIVASRLKGVPEENIEFALLVGGLSEWDVIELMRLNRATD